MNMKLEPEESELIGKWIFENDHICGDEVCNRITWLTDSYLRLIATSGGGWEKLYLDPEDQRYWELTYPEGNFHEVGPMRLSVISASDAKIKYHWQ